MTGVSDLKQYHMLVLIFFSSITVSIIMLYLNFPIAQMTLATSPSFVKQEILSGPHKWQFWKDSSQLASIVLKDGRIIEVENAKNISQCNMTDRQKLIFPKISSVSYISDGKFLNGTLWLADKFIEPTLNDRIDIYPSFLQIMMSDQPKKIIANTSDLANYVDERIARMYDPFHNFTIEENKSSTMISGNKAYRLVYSATTEDGINVKNMTFWTMNNGKVYEITYSAMPNRYLENLPHVQQMINSFEIKRIDNINTTSNQTKHLIHNITSKDVLFSGLGIKLYYPYDWIEKKGRSDNQTTSVIFQSPYEDEAIEEPSWHKTKFGMALAIDTIQHPSVTDYRIEYSRDPDINSSRDIISWPWNKKFYEVSAEDRMRVLETGKNYTIFYDKENPYYIFFSVDLRKINFPEQYRAVFYIVEYIVLKHHLCRLVDTTPWAIIPPPKFTVSSINPSNPLVLRPGEERTIQITLKGNTHLPSEAVLSPYYSNHNNTSYNSKTILATFTPNTIYLSPYGSDTSTLNIRAFDNASKGYPYAVTIPISANISFPTTITNRGGEIFNNSKSMNLLQSSNLTLAVLPSYTLEEKFGSFISAWISPLSGLWTFLAGVAAVLTPLIIRIFKKKSKK